jgi:hypothetical protein
MVVILSVVGIGIVADKCGDCVGKCTSTFQEVIIYAN